jgi:hypothetical protein
MGIAPILGVPISELNFYPTILGAVLFGVGIALLIDAYGQPHGIHGLGIAGAIAINFCGSAVLIVWLLFTSLDLPLRGYIVLWTIAIIVMAIGSIELATKSWKQQ